MIELKLKRTLLRLDFSFFAAVSLFLFLDGSGFGMAAMCACGLHELSHLIIMTAFGIVPDAVTFYGAGIRISSERIEYTKLHTRLLVLAAGCLANFAAAALLWLFGEYEASAINLFTGIFNMLPLGELDGAALLKILLIKKCRPENIDRYMKTAWMVSAAVIASAIFISGGDVSFTLITTALYIMVMCGSRV